jgi:hypothetical protein
MLLAYDAAGNVIATLDHLVARDADGNVTGLVDFEAHEQAGGLRDIWNVDDATGSATWPEWIGAAAHEFTVELDRRHKLPLRALVHKESGHRRERVALEAAIVKRIEQGQPADIRDLVGGPNAHLRLDAKGKTLGRAKP